MVEVAEGEARSDGGGGEESRGGGGDEVCEFEEGRAGPGVESDMRRKVDGGGKFVGPETGVSLVSKVV